MSSFPILDLVVGLVFIFFLLSIICSSAVELCMSVRGTRAKMLTKWLMTIFDTQALDSHGIPMLDEKNKPLKLGQAIMDHCMLNGLSKPGLSTSYMNAENFVSALLDKITLKNAGSIKVGTPVQPPPDNLEAYIAAIKDSEVISGELKRVILMLANEAKDAAGKTDEKGTVIQNGLQHFRKKLENWFETSTERLTGSLKRKKVLPLTIIAAFFITITLNADTLLISKYLYENKAEAAAFADKAMASYKQYGDQLKKADSTKANFDTDSKQLEQNIDSFKSSIPKGLPLGWTNSADLFSLKNWTPHLPGWLATILAIMLGAPFWFDLLNKISNIRNTGPKPATADTKKEKKE